MEKRLKKLKVNQFEDIKGNVAKMSCYFYREIDLLSALRGFVAELKKKGIHQNKPISVVTLDLLLHKWFYDIYEESSTGGKE